MNEVTLTQYHYLMTLRQLSEEMAEVRCIDLAVTLGVARATTSRMIKSLIEKGFVFRHHRSLKLSTKGLELLEKSSQQYKMIYQYFSTMNLNAQEVKECTDVLVNHLSLQTLQHLCALIKR